jgi:hypothetical protein
MNPESDSPPKKPRKQTQRPRLLNSLEPVSFLEKLAERYHLTLVPETPLQEQDVDTLVRLRWYASRYANLVETAIETAIEQGSAGHSADPSSRMLAAHIYAETHCQHGYFLSLWLQTVKIQNTVSARVDRWFAAQRKTNPNRKSGKDTPNG